MTPRKLSIFFGFPSYGGNGGISSEVPDIRKWFTKTVLAMSKDSRISEWHEDTIGDTPVTMVRNRFVTKARACKADVLVMVDSDMHPDRHLEEPGAKPFFETSFDFLYKHYDKGPCVIGAPYCGPPNGTENVYVFDWDNYGNRGAETPFALTAYSRRETFNLTGIQPCAALPTGLIMYDMRAFELIEPSHYSRPQVLDRLISGQITKEQALIELREGFFSYEWTSGYADEKASTEDVQNTRDISMTCQQVLGYNPVYCNWDAWAGHWKPWCVDKPRIHCVENIADNFKNAVLNKQTIHERVMYVKNDAIERRMKRTVQASDHPVAVPAGSLVDFDGRTE